MFHRYLGTDHFKYSPRRNLYRSSSSLSSANKYGCSACTPRQFLHAIISYIKILQINSTYLRTTRQPRGLVEDKQCSEDHSLKSIQHTLWKNELKDLGVENRASLCVWLGGYSPTPGLRGPVSIPGQFSWKL